MFIPNEPHGIGGGDAFITYPLIWTNTLPLTAGQSPWNMVPPGSIYMLRAASCEVHMKQADGTWTRVLKAK